ncbi:hypothetical protein RhiirA5_318078 [Rhizophagus irregularis]|uniref:Crinkler effector protein N-terminal domain-containing protein n=3 Tax=Rhizophagus irregularis TaxID=588596 RepID=A0A2I1EBG9_9GLOM|nr:hypothetical protein GLOIN_2v1844131 [Rhizophagus irregularis DAOM 181602=DAOM 197198]EXX72579.1 hypothetical protein RirG_068000 [Rhizophagus irregularis DAOM 197198w]PKC00145.1 hypothetical protein RhiirA5_318078 [Rhizophagus irregularis]PKC58390.1 hypothetical protein RhiirA1_445822 [Rhizophagus irregularis]PKY19475.1 hypothetical protein RhiirB3_523547 [Rhizophagus irregularis]POG66553.1 hypothetical protein GLOIN_2v1844131 [Rhizophagus irregularis DAOM 181602=DAOM 197198]|eukprot:XP_025173419.1 hypothetical protein GLOIN_2v1844131 [Rhizophagus irregularis DAOM 181602=DAOM 197198]
MSGIIRLSCLVFGDPIENAFTVKVDKDETISELKEIIKTKKQNTFNDVDANELSLWKINASLDELNQFICKNDTDIKTIGEKLFPLNKVGKEFPEPAGERVHVIVQHNKASISIAEKIKELETKLNSINTSCSNCSCSNSSSTLVVNNLRADTISCKYIRFFDDYCERWQIAYESRTALVFRDHCGEGDKRYAMPNNIFKDL